MTVVVCDLGLQETAPLHTSRLLVKTLPVFFSAVWFRDLKKSFLHYNRFSCVTGSIKYPAQRAINCLSAVSWMESEKFVQCMIVVDCNSGTSSLWNYIEVQHNYFGLNFLPKLHLSPQWQRNIACLSGFTEANTSSVCYTVRGCWWCTVSAGVLVVLQTCLWLWASCQLIIWYIILNSWLLVLAI